MKKTLFERYAALNGVLRKIIEGYKNKAITKEEFTDALKELDSQVKSMLKETHEAVKNQDKAFNNFKRDFIQENGEEAFEHFLELDNFLGSQIEADEMEVPPFVFEGEVICRLFRR